MRLVSLYWDPDRELFMDEGGFEVAYVCKWLPNWAMELALLYRDRGECYFAFPFDACIIVEIFWPDEDVENWYL